VWVVTRRGATAALLGWVHATAAGADTLPSVCGPCISPCFGTDLCVVRVQLDRVQPVCMHPGSRAVDPGILLML
jgi:hypothetical protein